MKRTLVVGCSDITCVYKPDDSEDTGQTSWLLKLFERYDGVFKSISLPGHGVHLYASILERLDQSGKLGQFDNLIVQMTSELRLRQYPENFDPFPEIFIKIDTDKTETLRFFKTMEKPVYSSNAIELYDRYENYFSNTQGKIDFTKVLTDMTYQDNTLIKILYNHIEFLCKKNDIKSYYISTRGIAKGLTPVDLGIKEKYLMEDTHDWIYKYFARKYCGTEEQFDLIKTGHMSSALHPTRKITDDITNLVYERLEAHEFKG